MQRITSDQSAHPSPDILARALLDCAKDHPWRRLTLDHVARAAQIPAQTLLNLYHAPIDLIPFCVAYIDDESTQNIDTTETKTPPKERLFDALMARFDILQNNRQAVCRIAAAAQHVPDLTNRLVQAHWKSMGKILDVCRISKDGPRLFLQKTALMAVFHFTFQRWEKDESDDMSKTMAFLNRSLSKFPHLYA